MKNFPILFNFVLVLSAIYAIASIVYFISGSPYSSYVLVSGIVPLTFLIMRVTESRKFIDNKIHSIIGNLKEYGSDWHSGRRVEALAWKTDTFYGNPLQGFTAPWPGRRFWL